MSYGRMNWSGWQRSHLRGPASKAGSRLSGPHPGVVKRNWGERRESNPHAPDPQSGALTAQATLATQKGLVPPGGLEPPRPVRAPASQTGVSAISPQGDIGPLGWICTSTPNEGHQLLRLASLHSSTSGCRYIWSRRLDLNQHPTDLESGASAVAPQRERCSAQAALSLVSGPHHYALRPLYAGLLGPLASGRPSASIPCCLSRNVELAEGGGFEPPQV